MSDNIEPALTAEEWKAALDNSSVKLHMLRTWASWGAEGNTRKLVALALHGQPFGFTWEMVDVLDYVMAIVKSSAAPATARVLRDLSGPRDRIAALLPPRDARAAGS
jgi:hypothetical protein